MRKPCKLMKADEYGGGPKPDRENLGDKSKRHIVHLERTLNERGNNADKQQPQDDRIHRDLQSIYCKLQNV